MLTELILKAVIENIDHSIIICDKEGNFVLWNDCATKMIGVNENLNKKVDWQEHFGVFKMDGVRYRTDDMPIVKAITNGAIIKKERMYISNQNPSESKYIEVDAFPIRNENGEIIAGVATFNDVTSKIKMEKIVDELTSAFAHMKILIENSFFK